MSTTQNTTNDAQRLTDEQLKGRLARTPDGETGEIVDVEEPAEGHRRVLLDLFDGEYGKNIALERVEVGQ